MNFKSNLALLAITVLSISACSNNSDQKQDTRIDDTAKIDGTTSTNLESKPIQQEPIKIKFDESKYHEVSNDYFIRRSIKSHLSLLNPGENINGENSRIYINLARLVSEVKGYPQTNENPYRVVTQELNPVKQHDNAKQLLIDAQDSAKGILDTDFIKLKLSAIGLPTDKENLTIRTRIMASNYAGTPKLSLSSWDVNYPKYIDQKLVGIRTYDMSSVHIPINEQQAADIKRNEPVQINGYAYVTAVLDNKRGPSNLKLDHLDFSIVGGDKELLTKSTDVTEN